jgi:uncharacterized protein (DUF2461 family)
MSPDQLDRYRRAVDDDRTGRKLVDVVKATRAKGMDVEGHGTLKTAPRGYAKDHPRIELLRNKGLLAWKRWPAGPAGDPKEQGPGGPSPSLSRSP